MNWIELTTEEETEKIKTISITKPVVIFKHSARCSISNMAKNRLERIPDQGNALFYHLDVLRYRAISNNIAGAYHVHHESPQVLLITKGECVYEESHNGITVQDLEEEISKVDR